MFTDRAVLLHLTRIELIIDLISLSAGLSLKHGFQLFNHLSGEIPPSFATLPVFDSLLFLDYNDELHTADAGLINYLEQKNPTWNENQIIAPADFDLHCEELLLMLDEELRTIAMLRLLGHTNRDIARQLGCTERKVERKLNLVRLRWKDEFAEHPESPSP
jgi:hypothetical protein